jgi:hypothetical protein
MKADFTIFFFVGVRRRDVRHYEWLGTKSDFMRDPSGIVHVSQKKQFDRHVNMRC